MYAKELKDKLKDIDDDVEVFIETVDGLKPIYSIREDEYQCFTGIDFDYQPIEETFSCFVITLGHDIFRGEVMSDQALFNKCCDDRDKLIYKIAEYVKKGLTDNGKRKLSQATCEKWNDILWDLHWKLPVTDNHKVCNYSVDSNGCLHFHE